MDLKLQQKSALVCASSEGIGKAVAMSLAGEGVAVCLLSRDRERLAQAAAEIESASKSRVIFQCCDLSCESELKHAYSVARQELGPIDILINNQGGPRPGELEEVADSDIEHAVQLNLNAVIKLSRLCLPEMAQRGFGRVINVLSITAKESMPRMMISNTLRPAVLGFAKSLAHEHAAHGITINSVLPSAVLTKRAESLLREKAAKDSITYQQALEASVAALPIKRFASGAEVADLVTFLASPIAAYINGTAIPVDGGYARSL